MGFSRGDWITAALTLILFSLAYYLRSPSPTVALVCLVLGILILLVMIFRRREKEQAPSVSQSVQQTANPTINVNIGTPTSSQPLSEPLPLTPEPKHNIHFLEAKSVKAHSGLSDGQIYESPQGLGDYMVSIVCFRNDPIIGQSVQQPRLKAHIIYKDKNGHELTDAPRGVWANHSGEAVRFETAQRKCLVVLLFSNQGTWMKVWNEAHTPPRHFPTRGPIFLIRSEGISQNIASIEIELLAEDVCVAHAAFDVSPGPAGQLPTLVRRSFSVA